MKKYLLLKTLGAFAIVSGSAFVLANKYLYHTAPQPFTAGKVATKTNIKTAVTTQSNAPFDAGLSILLGAGAVAAVKGRKNKKN